MAVAALGLCITPAFAFGHRLKSVPPDAPGLFIYDSSIPAQNLAVGHVASVEAASARSRDIRHNSVLPVVPQQLSPGPTSWPSRKPKWGPNTSGPFFTGTAEVEPAGSLYLEPYFFGFLKSGSSSLSFPQKIAVGMGHHLEFDAIIPLTQNRAEFPATPAGRSVSAFGPGDAHLSFKYQLTSDANTRSVWARPALTLTADFFLPSGNFTNLNPNLYGADQFGNGTFDEGVSLLVRKRAKPFVIYGQSGFLLQDSATVGPNYGFNNGVTSVPPGVDLEMVDGNLFYYSTALEYVLSTRHGVGFLTEMAGEAQTAHNLAFGRATAPSFSYLTLSPEAEFTWPTGKQFAITWGGGVAIPVERDDFVRQVTPMFTATFYFNGPQGGRGSH
jgi:hypothetical protein